MSEQRRNEMVYLTIHSTHFIYGYMVLDHADSQGVNHAPSVGTNPVAHWWGLISH